MKVFYPMPIFLNAYVIEFLLRTLALVKYIASILLVCILGLTIQPILPHISIAKCQIAKAEKNCCAMKHQGEKKDHKQKKDDCCSNGLCTFFGGSCGCCLGFCAYPLAFQFKKQPIINVMNAHVGQTTSYDLSVQDFHPPESA